MSDPVQSFEFILKNQCAKNTSGLYRDNQTANKHIYKPQDVISSVSSQLRAIQMADTLKSLRKCPKELNKYKQTEFLCVNNLPVYEQVPKSNTKFDTQCVTDTQLINIIEDAEVLDAHRGMTQEFETTFIHNTEKNEQIQEQETSVNRNGICTAGEAKRNNLDVELNCANLVIRNKSAIKEINEGTDIKNSSTSIDSSPNSLRPSPCKEMNRRVDFDSNENVNDIELSQILNPKTFSKRLIMNEQCCSCINLSIQDENTQIENYRQVPLIQNIEIQDSSDTYIPLSPILCNKDLRANLDSPAHLTCNLDDFERFESIVVPIIESNDMETVKHIINSQILHKELHIQINEDVKLKKRDITKLMMDKDKKEGFQIQHTNTGLIQVNKALSEAVSDELSLSTPKNDKTAGELSSEVLKDEILFSSDEEDCVTKDVQDLPFTCALGTSFYTQSDVLDKTMYVGFQTASNKSIQVCADSFNKAKSLLIDASDDKVTVTELVRKCDDAAIDHSINKKICVNTDDMIFNSPGCLIESSDSHRNNNNISHSQSPDVSQHNYLNMPQELNNFLGVNVITKPKISLPENVSARCVFQDDHLNSNFEIDQNYLRKTKVDVKIKAYSDGSEIKSLVNDVLQCIDDDIIEEFVNTEMSLEEDKKENIDTVPPDVKIKNNLIKNVPDLNPSKTKVLDPVDNTNLNNSPDKHKVKHTATSQVPDELKIHEDVAMMNMEGFKTASNKNINISISAWLKSKSILENIDQIKLPDKELKDNKKINKPNIKQSFIENGNTFDRAPNNQNSDYALAQMKNIINDFNAYQLDAPRGTKESSSVFKKDFVGFKTANNENINISAKAWSRTKNIFDDIDFTKLPNETNKEYPNADMANKNMHSCCIDDPFSSVTSVNNNTLDTALRQKIIKTVDHYENRDLPNCSSDNVHNIRHRITKKKRTVKDSMDVAAAIDNYDRVLSANILECIGFKTASNRDVNISNEALIRTKNIFKDIDSTEIKLPNKIINKHLNLNMETAKTTKCNEIRNDSNFANASNINVAIDDIRNFQSFKTASNKNIKISSDAWLESKRILSDVDDNFSVSHKIDKQCNTKAKDFRKYDNVLKFVSNDKLKTKPSSPLLTKPDCQTESNNIKTISENSPEKENNVFDSLYNEIPLNMFEKPFSGFQTASNKQVKISEKALVNSRRILNDIGILDNKSYKNKQRKVKDLYPEEIFQSNNTSKNDLQASNTRNNLITKTFEGFHTANNRTVSVSKCALEGSKKLFQNMTNMNEAKSNCTKCLPDNNEVVKISEDITETKESNIVNKLEGFKGFQTASNKNVIVSEKALAATKSIFKDLETEYMKDVKVNIGFQTGNNKAISVSREALANSKRLFAEIDEEKHTVSSKKEKKVLCNGLDEDNINCFIDDEVINNFDETLHTEDFREIPTKSKRSGSPILLCSRKKKRKKFETPYKLESISEFTPKPLNTNKIDKKIYRDDYKKSKKYTLKDLKEITKDKKTKIDPYLLEFNYDILLEFQFKHDRNDLMDGVMTTDLLKEYFIKTVSSKLIPKDWLDNHLKLILWKLISYEIIFKSVFCTAKNVLEQLNYRYIKELYNAERPALRKILEKDDVPTKTMVLCVVQIYVDGVSVISVTNLNSNIELLVTDGWYCVQCTIDRMLAELVISNKIIVGCKLVTTGAELMGCEQGVSPWEDTSAVRLKIFGNSTRRARWDARLGYHGNGAMLTELSSVKVLGGKVSKLRAYVTRVYPALYVEKFEDGSTVTRSERLENLHQMKTETDRQVFMEKIYEDVEKEFADRESQDSEGLPDSCKITMESGSQIAKMMKRNKDPQEFRAQLTHSQTRLLEEHTTKKHDRLLQEIQTRVRERIEKASVCVNRNVVSLLKIRIAGIREREDNVEVTKGMMSIWKSNDAVQEIIKEGAWIDIMNVVPTSIRFPKDLNIREIWINIIPMYYIRIVSRLSSTLLKREDTRSFERLATWGYGSNTQRPLEKFNVKWDGTSTDDTPRLHIIHVDCQRNGEIQISAGRQSMFSTSKFKPSEKIRPHMKLLLRQCYPIKNLAQNPVTTTDFNEIDTVGFIFLIDPEKDLFDSTKQSFQNIYLCDSDKNMICVNFWGGLKKFGFQNVLDTGQIIACVNLQKRAGNTRKSIPQYRVTEFSYFTQTPRNDNAKKILEELNKKMSCLDRRKFCQECLVLKNNYAVLKQNNENVSPYRYMNNSDINASKNKIFIDSPVVRPDTQENFNLTGLDFESTLKENSQLSEELLKRKRKVNEKIARLKMYGEPPPLAPMHIMNSSKQASSFYKSPLISNNNKPASHIKNNNTPKNFHQNDLIPNLKPDSDSLINVADLKNTPRICGAIDCEITNSPVLMNKTFVKSVNPVKINFDAVEDNDDSNIDHFAEEFDASPPLSLE